MENYTAAMLEPYLLPGKKDVRGIPMVEPEKLKEAVTRLDAEGFQVHFHAIGDARDPPVARRRRGGARGERRPGAPPPHLAYSADRQCRCPALQGARRRRELPAALGLCGRLHHRAHDSVPRPRALVAHVRDQQPREERRDRRLRQRLVGVEPESLRQMETAITRLGALGETTEPFLPEEAITLAQALDAFTINAAYVNRLEKDTGSLEVGKQRRSRSARP